MLVRQDKDFITEWVQKLRMMIQQSKGQSKTFRKRECWGHSGRWNRHAVVSWVFSTWLAPIFLPQHCCQRVRGEQKKEDQGQVGQRLISHQEAPTSIKIKGDTGGGSTGTYNSRCTEGDTQRVAPYSVTLQQGREGNAVHFFSVCSCSLPFSVLCFIGGEQGQCCLQLWDYAQTQENECL